MSIGADEAGRGPVIGPLVISAVHAEDTSWMAGVGVKDSKLLSPDRREELSGRIGRECSFCIVEVPAASIDEARSSMDLNTLEVLAFSCAIGSLIMGREVRPSGLPQGCTVELSGGSSPGRIMVDAADVDEKRFAERISFQLARIADMKGYDVQAQHRADSNHPEVSASSILAKVRRDQRVRDIAAEMGERIGSGYPSDEVTRSFLARYLEEHGRLPPHTRTTWETSRDLVGRMRNRPLSDFLGHDP